jgi:hypothetical protein
MVDAYTKKVHRDLEQGVAVKIYDGEVKIERMLLSKVEEISKYHDLWTSYRENLATKEPS